MTYFSCCKVRVPGVIYSATPFYYELIFDDFSPCRWICCEVKGTMCSYCGGCVSVCVHTVISLYLSVVDGHAVGGCVSVCVHTVISLYLCCRWTCCGVRRTGPTGTCSRVRCSSPPSWTTTRTGSRPEPTPSSSRNACSTPAISRASWRHVSINILCACVSVCVLLPGVGEFSVYFLHSCFKLVVLM